MKTSSMLVAALVLALLLALPAAAQQTQGGQQTQDQGSGIIRGRPADRDRSARRLRAPDRLH